MLCENCKRENTGDSAFCKFCGAPLNVNNGMGQGTQIPPTSMPGGAPPYASSYAPPKRSKAGVIAAIISALVVVIAAVVVVVVVLNNRSDSPITPSDIGANSVIESSRQPTASPSNSSGSGTKTVEGFLDLMFAGEYSKAVDKYLHPSYIDSKKDGRQGIIDLWSMYVKDLGLTWDSTETYTSSELTSEQIRLINEILYKEGYEAKATGGSNVFRTLYLKDGSHLKAGFMVVNIDNMWTIFELTFEK